MKNVIDFELAVENAKGLTFGEQLKVLASVCDFVLNHPERINKFAVSSVTECDYYNYDETDKKVSFHTSFSFIGELGDLLEKAFALFIYEDKEESLFNFTIVKEEEILQDPESYLNSTMSYSEFMVNIFKHFSGGGGLSEIKESFAESVD